MRDIMKKYLKFWPILGMIVLFIVHFIYERPRSVENILGISSDATFEFCYVHVRDWNEDILSTKGTELTQDEFKHVVQMMKENRYRKYSGNEVYISHTGDYYSITLSYFMNGNQEERQTITLMKGDLIDINDSLYAVSSEKAVSKGMVSEIYEYISSVIEERY